MSVFTQGTRKEDQVLFCKLDLEEAYDIVDWCFLQYLLHKMGFDVKCKNWIKECVASASCSIIIHGTTKGLFLAQRGLRQGDLLSPFLFVIVAETLSMMVKVAANRGLMMGFKVAATAPSVSLLQFTDDTLIFCEAFEDQIRSESHSRLF